MATPHVTFALAIPHTPWIPERVARLERILTELAGGMHPTQVFADREPNWAWSGKLWQWGVAADATHLVQLQDDVELAPNFWRKLGAMVRAVPDQVIALHGAHPKFTQIAREGHRWAKSRAWVVGVGYVIPRDLLGGLVDYRGKLPPEQVRGTNEDELIAHWCMRAGLDVYHPIPTIVDHDTTIPSTYRNDENKFRRPFVTWRDFLDGSLERDDFWTLEGAPPVVLNPHYQSCWFCENEPGAVGFRETGAFIGRQCLAQATASLLTTPVPQVRP
jgi:hypothetical protein